MSREEAVVEVFREYSSEWNNSEEAAVDVLAAADAHDAAHSIHRLELTDATVERAARVIDSQAWQDSWIEFNPEGCKRAREAARTKARAVLAAAVEAGQ